TYVPIGRITGRGITTRECGIARLYVTSRRGHCLRMSRVLALLLVRAGRLCACAARGLTVLGVCCVDPANGAASYSYPFSCRPTRDFYRPIPNQNGASNERIASPVAALGCDSIARRRLPVQRRAR